MEPLTQASLLAVRDQHEEWLHAQPGVVGSGVGMDNGGAVCLKVFTNRPTAATLDAIRERLGAVPVAFEETGEIRKQPG